jgi:hypothetical protein
LPTTLDGDLQLGYHAGYGRAALALESWAWQLNNPADKLIPGVTSYPSQDLLLEDVKSKVWKEKARQGASQEFSSSVPWEDAAEGQSTFVSRYGYRTRTY